MSFFNSGIRIEFQNKIPTMHSPPLICGFPGTGYVGKMSVDHLINEMKAIHLADIYCTSFPPRVIVGSDGLVELTRNSMYYSKRTESNESDFLFVTGDSQPIDPQTEYYLAEEILNIVKKFKTSLVITMGAYITGTFSDKPNVYCAATHKRALQLVGGENIVHLNEGTVTGMNGLILGISKLFKMEGICLLGETSGYVMDAIASKNVLHALMRVMNIKVGMQNIENRAKDTEMLIRTIEQQVANKMTSSPQVGGQVSSKRQPDTGYIS